MVSRHTQQRNRTRSITQQLLNEGRQTKRAREAEEGADVSQGPSQLTDDVDNDKPKWKPSIIVGSPLWIEGEDLSAIELAERKIEQRKLWVEHYQGVPEFERMLQEAIREREQLDEADEVSTKPRSECLPLETCTSLGNLTRSSGLLSFRIKTKLSKSV